MAHTFPAWRAPIRMYKNDNETAESYVRDALRQLDANEYRKATQQHVPGAVSIVKQSVLKTHSPGGVSTPSMASILAEFMNRGIVVNHVGVVFLDVAHETIDLSVVADTLSAVNIEIIVSNPVNVPPDAEPVFVDVTVTTTIPLTHLTSISVSIDTPNCNITWPPADMMPQCTWLSMRFGNKWPTKPVAPSLALPYIPQAILQRDDNTIIIDGVSAAIPPLRQQREFRQTQFALVLAGMRDQRRRNRRRPTIPPEIHALLHDDYNTQNRVCVG